MFDKLFAFIQSFWNALVFWFVVDQYERCVVLRLGKFNRVCEPGLHFKIPLGIESIGTDNVVPRTCVLGEQTLETKDAKIVVVSGIATVRIFDIRRALLDVECVDMATTDVLYGVVTDAVENENWEDLREFDIKEQIVEESNRALAEYGVVITKFSFADFARIRTYRLMVPGG